MEHDDNSNKDKQEIPRIDFNDTQELKSAQTYIVLASIMGPVSIIIGGVLLSSVGVVLGILAYRKLKKLIDANGFIKSSALNLKNFCIAAIVICSAALLLNAISVAMFFPLMVEALESGDYSAFISNTGGLGYEPETNKTWG